VLVGLVATASCGSSSSGGGATGGDGGTSSGSGEDNRVAYFFAHMSELAGAHAVGAAFGAGAGDQTEPETDGNNFVNLSKAYFTAGGQRLCQ